jgi:RHS repeat-associated protein
MSGAMRNMRQKSMCDMSHKKTVRAEHVEALPNPRISTSSMRTDLISATLALLLSLFVFNTTAQAAVTATLTSPTANTTVTAPGSFILTATATSSNSTIKNVAFYRGTTLLKTVTAAPYTYTWANVAAGTYSLTAKATDNKNATKTSTAVSVKVVANVPPTVSLTSPATNATANAPGSFTLAATAASTTSTIAKVDFYNGTTLLGTATAAPYTYTWTNIAAGTYSITAKATDAKNAVTTSAVIPVSVVNANVPPTVSITSPAANAVATAPATIALSANAADSDGTISKVEFYNGTTLLSTAAVAPYTYVWSNVAAGSYSLTAKATDNLGAQTTSIPVAVVVNPGAAQAYYIYVDHLDTPRQITDTAGNVVWTWDNQDPFGNNVANENPSGLGTFTNNLRFPGQYADKETNTYQNFHRDYDPSTGRYVQSDPIGLKGGSFSTYTYVGSNPLGYVDPLGLSSLAACANPVNAAACAEAGIGAGASAGSSSTAGQGAAAATAAAVSADSGSSSSSSDEAECEAQYDRDIKECRAYSAMTGDKYTFVACKKNAESRLSKCMSKCGKN